MSPFYRRLLSLAIATLFIVVASGTAPFVRATTIPSTTRTQMEIAPLSTSATVSEKIAGQYIVVYKPNRVLSPAETADLVRSVGGTLLFTYQRALQGFAIANLSEAGLARLQSHPFIASIEQDQWVTLADQPLDGDALLYLPLIQGGGGKTTPTPTGTATSTVAPSATPSSTATTVVVSPTPSTVATATAAPSGTATATPIPSATTTAIPSNTATATPSPSATASPTISSTATSTSTTTPTVSPTATTVGVETQENAPWGLDRTDQRTLPLNTTYTYSLDGTGVHAYVIDTGIRATHQEFTGRVGVGFDAIDGDDTPDDCNGHGTHVAGTIGGTTYGIAKGVTLHGVRVLGCTGGGTLASVLAGIDWVAENAQAPAVANMSLGSGVNSTIDDAVQALIDTGVIVVVSAGNSNTDACNGSPAHLPDALTIAASAIDDSRWEASNWGTCVDLFAPGHQILSAGIASDTASATDSGTSMAAPHIAGVAALVLEANPTYTQGDMVNFILDNATPNVITDPQGSPNFLLFSPYGNPNLASPTATYRGTVAQENFISILKTVGE